MKEETNMSLVPAKFRFTTKEKILMIVIIVLMVVGIVATWINCAKIIKANAEYKLAYQQYQEALIKEQEELERKRQEKLPKLTETGIENMNHIYSSDTKRVFLTFDDGPSSNTNQILDILNERGIKATFFVLGSNVEKKPEVVIPQQTSIDVKKCMKKPFLKTKEDVQEFINLLKDELNAAIDNNQYVQFK